MCDRSHVARTARDRDTGKFSPHSLATTTHTRAHLFALTHTHTQQRAYKLRARQSGQQALSTHSLAVLVVDVTPHRAHTHFYGARPRLVCTPLLWALIRLNFIVHFKQSNLVVVIACAPTRGVRTLSPHRAPEDAIDATRVCRRTVLCAREAEIPIFACVSKKLRGLLLLLLLLRVCFCVCVVDPSVRGAHLALDDLMCVPQPHTPHTHLHIRARVAHKCFQHPVRSRA